MTTALWLIALPLVTSPFVYLAGRIQLNRPAVSRWIALIGLAIMWVFFFQAAREFSMKGVTQTLVSTIALRIDGVSLLLTAVALILGTLVVIYSGAYIAGEDNQEKYYALIIVMIGAMIGLACAADLFNLWIWFEAMAVSSYLLVVFYRQQPASLEAGVKYLVQSATGSVFVLLGIALVFLQTGALDLQTIVLTEPSPILLGAGALFAIGFGVKVAMMPLHTWLPDAHAQAPSGISAMLSGVVIEAGLIALLRVILALTGVTLSWGMLLMGFGAVNMLGGNLMALRQKQVKRLLAYSSLSHVGYMLLGLGMAIYSGQADGAQGGLFHLFTHGLMKGLAFLAAGGLLYGLHLANGHHTPLTLTDLRGASTRYPLVSLTFTIALLGLGGLPPLAGFMSKWQIFVAGFQTENIVIAGLVIFAALNSVFSLAYYVPLVNALYRQHPSNAVQHGQPLPHSLQIPLVLLALAVVIIGLWPGLVNWLIEGGAVAALLNR